MFSLVFTRYMHHAEDSGPGTISNRGSAFFSEDQYVLNKTSTVYDAIFLSILWQQWLQCFPWHRCHKLVGQCSLSIQPTDVHLSIHLRCNWSEQSFSVLSHQLEGEKICISDASVEKLQKTRRIIDSFTTTTKFLLHKKSGKDSIWTVYFRMKNAMGSRPFPRFTLQSLICRVGNKHTNIAFLSSARKKSN